MEKIGDLAFSVLEQRAWRLARYQFLPPYRFAELMVEFSGASVDGTMAELKFEWETLQAAEIRAVASGPWNDILRQAYWHKFSAIRLTWMLLEEADWTWSPAVEDWFHALFRQISDSKVVEDTHNVLRFQAKRETINQLPDARVT